MPRSRRWEDLQATVKIGTCWKICWDMERFMALADSAETQ